jgi:hypothetical protein
LPPGAGGEEGAMKHVMISTLQEARYIGEKILSGRAQHVMTRAGRAYFHFPTNDRCSDRTFLCPVDGSLLVECRCFDTELEARAWLTRGVGLRLAQAGGVE